MKKHILVTGASGGIGSAVAAHLCEREDVGVVIGTYHRNKPAFHGEKMHWVRLDASCEADVEALLSGLSQLDWIINCVGILLKGDIKPEKTIATINPSHFMTVISTNTLPSLLLAKHARHLLKNSPEPVFAVISARVGSIGENGLGGWYSYRISKSALNMAVRTLALEWARAMPAARVVALHPGTVDTDLSLPFQKSVPKDKLFTADRAAQMILKTLDSLGESSSGQFLSWDGTELPW